MNRSVFQRIHNPRNRQCGCDPDCSSRRSNQTPTSVASLPPYGVVFVAGSLLWGMAADGFKPDRYDITGALICLVGVSIIMYSPRPD